VHADQLGHVKKGCLARHRQDIASDGSRIEGSHKGWNSLQRAQPSGIEMYAALAHDFVLRRNIRVFLLHEKTRKQPSTTDLLVSFSSGSHHISLLGHLAISFNSLLDKEPQDVRATLSPLPVFQDVNTDEVFGLVRSEHTESFGGLLIIKEEVKETEDQVLQELSRRISEDSDTSGDSDLSTRLGIDPKLLSIANQPSGIRGVIEKSPNPIPGPSSKRKASPIILDDDSPEPSRKKVHIASTLGLEQPDISASAFMMAPLLIQSENSSGVDEPVSALHFDVQI
jgi:hypothetical protein